ncbi:Rpn family recombination-promoting nuclease/putative transposase [Gracilibacillus massiliensis]|uniref:Rpn family recombination-promoting nuclease/putative transposase n=1 Tax=Gracilibacillus massiliensis TaxID=1564956 RepID=UPI001E4FDA7D|nr:Rpn family recombination-promoting nuclease/putative transposase [Gracilibacillus massiliensis]
MMIVIIQNPHDTFFKETFSNVEVAKSFIQHYLPTSIVNLIEVESIQPQKDSFISKELREYFSDLLFQVKLNETEAYLHLLFEHKSYPSKTIVFQLLRYMIEIWEAKMEKEKQKELPIVIPIVIFHSERKWNYPKNLNDMLQGFDTFSEDIKQYIPDFAYILFDVSNYDDEDLKGIAQLKIILTIFRDMTTKNKQNAIKAVKRSIYYLQQLDDQERAIQYLETLLRYVFHLDRQLTKADFHDMIKYVESSYSEGSEMVMTLADLFRDEGKREGKKEGMQEGIQEGMHKGIQEGLAKGKAQALASTVIRLLTKFVAPVPEELNQQIQKQDPETLEAIIEHIDEFDTLEQVKQYLK